MPKYYGGALKPGVFVNDNFSASPYPCFVVIAANGCATHSTPSYTKRAYLKDKNGSRRRPPSLPECV